MGKTEQNVYCGSSKFFSQSKLFEKVKPNYINFTALGSSFKILQITYKDFPMHFILNKLFTKSLLFLVAYKVNMYLGDERFMDEIIAGVPNHNFLLNFGRQEIKAKSSLCSNHLKIFHNPKHTNYELITSEEPTLRIFKSDSSHSKVNINPDKYLYPSSISVEYIPTNKPDNKREYFSREKHSSKNDKCFLSVDRIILPDKQSRLSSDRVGKELIALLDQGLP